MKTLQIKGELQIKPGWLAIATSGLYEELKNRHVDDNGSIVFVTVEDEAKYKTNLQNKFFHKLIEIYYKSGQFDYSDIYQRPSKNMQELKIDIKFRLGVEPVEIETRKDLVGLKNGEFIENHNKVYFIKSWASYTKKQARETIDLLMIEMNQKGIDLDQESLTYNEIYKGKEDLPIF